MSGGALSAYIGSAGQVDALRTALLNHSLPHAVLLTAPEGCGRNFLARCLAADYLYPNGGEGAKAVLRGESPEVMLIEGEGASGQIKIDRVRQVRRDLFHTALSAAGRVVMIRDAERMMAPPANALLKVLEEPPGEVLFILTARDAAALPATIRSRCALYPLAPLSQRECEEALERGGVSGQDAGFLAAVYGGRLGLCLKAAGDAGRMAVLCDALSAAQAAGKKDRYTLMALLSRYEGRGDEERERRLAFCSDFADVLAAALRGRADEANLAPQTAAWCLPLVQDTQGALLGNAAPKLALTALAVRLTQ